MSVVHLVNTGGYIEVWLDLEGGCVRDGIVIGTGATIPVALENARRDLGAALLDLDEAAGNPARLSVHGDPVRHE